MQEEEEEVVCGGGGTVCLRPRCLRMGTCGLHHLRLPSSIRGRRRPHAGGSRRSRLPRPLPRSPSRRARWDCQNKLRGESGANDERAQGREPPAPPPPALVEEEETAARRLGFPHPRTEIVSLSLPPVSAPFFALFSHLSLPPLSLSPPPLSPPLPFRSLKSSKARFFSLYEEKTSTKGMHSLTTPLELSSNVQHKCVLLNSLRFLSLLFVFVSSLNNNNNNNNNKPNLKPRFSR